MGDGSREDYGISINLAVSKITEAMEHTREFGWPITDWRANGMYQAIKILKELPPVSDNTRTAGWITMSDADGLYFCCSECGNELPRYYMDKPTVDNYYPPKYSVDKTPYCPTCGARMTKEGD